VIVAEKLKKEKKKREKEEKNRLKEEDQTIAPAK